MFNARLILPAILTSAIMAIGCSGASASHEALEETSAAASSSTKVNVILTNASVLAGPGGKFEFAGSVSVRDVGNPKTIKIVYTKDHWATTATLDAEYRGHPNLHEVFERWSFSSNSNPSEVIERDDVIEFAVAYEVNGQTYWDNNDQRNFTTNPSNIRYPCELTWAEAQADGTVRAQVKVRPLAPVSEESVLVRYGVNGGLTGKSTAHYVRQSVDGREIWEAEGRFNEHGNISTFGVVANCSSGNLGLEDYVGGAFPSSVRTRE